MITQGPTVVTQFINSILGLGFMWLFGPLIAFEIAALIYEYVVRGGGSSEK